MRITSLALQDRWLRALNRHNERIGETVSQISAGRQLLRPADGPGQMPTLLDGQQALAMLQAYRRRAAEAQGWMEATDQVLASTGDVLQRARELTVLAASDSISPEGRAGIRVEMQQLADEVERLGKSQLDGRPLFDGSTMQLRLSDEQTVDLNLGPAGQQLFTDLKATLDKVLEHLGDSGSAQDLSADLQNLDDRLSELLEQRSVNGVRQARVERVISQLDQLEVRLNQHLTDTDGFDVAKAAAKLSSEQAAYQATLAVVARLSNLSLVDYLR
ncbi:MAG: hypothetical protein IMX01_05105 [Limnochordaceae bacterium]|nr:hypothetical protein [Limnochordaceae bacterium]